ncbi:pre-rRNA-processing protein esf1 [Coniosporium tulheliwenetii]|uniref:Pre-rRNA-processing protein esf1 n=1 Tax=Coniosporium tulheliwenetii TaxID=3383036 RepID=A0ACC2ZBF1_9PEZI|nr:pre-rRNA-processing protein esf1 [Cladosporium sp. JES 115]
MAPPPRQKGPKGRNVPKTSSTITDPRFSNIHTDPRYRLPSKRHTHVKLDQRFAHMLRDDDFSQKASVDRYGRRIEKGAGRRDLERFYRVEDEEDEDEDNDKEENEEKDDDDLIRKELRRADRTYDPAREGGFSSSDDSSSDDSPDEDDEEDVDVEDEAELAEGTAADVPMGEPSSRLAAVNLDWDNIDAVDIMAVASSFAPADGRILSVEVYPSEFGRERIEREQLEGPPREIFAAAGKRGLTGDDEEDESEDERIKKDLLAEDTGEEFNAPALRAYQLERLRYYYAVLTCSSAATAKALYDAMDGREYLSSANFFDLRFIPDGVSFEDDKPRDRCDRVPDGYRPKEFVTDALTHSKVKLTWDADDNNRKEVQKRAFSRAEIDENDLKAYVGSDSSDDEEVDEEEEKEDAANGFSIGLKGKKDKAAALRALLGLSGSEPKKTKKTKESAPVGDMQITFSSGLSTNAQKASVFENEPIRDETTVEAYIRKEKERKARRKERAKAGKDDAVVDGPAAAQNTADTKAAQDEDNADPFADPFFDDPAETSRKAARDARKADKARKREQRDAEAAASVKQRADLELLLADDEKMRHFDMNEIAKAEKEKKRRGKKGRKPKAGEGAADGDAEVGEGAGAEGFRLDTQDPRFARLFESHEFAIDPTNPKFKHTEGMKALLEEGRKKRKGARDEGVDAEDRVSKKAKQGGMNGAGRGEGDDLKKLVDKVKGKSKRA